MGILPKNIGNKMSAWLEKKELEASQCNHRWENIYSPSVGSFGCVKCGITKTGWDSRIQSNKPITKHAEHEKT